MRETDRQRQIDIERDRDGDRDGDRERERERETDLAEVVEEGGSKANTNVTTTTDTKRYSRSPCRELDALPGRQYNKLVKCIKRNYLYSPEKQ